VADPSEEGEAMGEILIMVKLILTVVKLAADLVTSILKLIKSANKKK